ncbi:hypothetical protein [Cellulosimicrobium protaetiae]|uniref:GlcNAc-PI de-N-acetylase n=1 Tax=Cellulosimicrobium protaetiae TaxID=2587808 RepID=A0A6M5UID1_9MICO|nr:hypothetical protein [Cellulosimicrobium protaetiae]QJW37844.1 hypothetical protein FIC82_018385 [Cellulosimicrobium protaetiae]
MRTVVLLAVVLSTLLGGCSALDAPRRLQVVVAPHPDDDLLGIAAVDDDDFTVWVVGTQGESTGYCEPDLLRPSVTSLGEWPVPTPAGRQSAECRTARLASWLGFHRDLSDRQGSDAFGAETGQLPELQEVPAQELGIGAVPRSTDTEEQASPILYSVGADAALVAFDGGDGNLTADEVEYMVTWVLAQRGALLPELDLSRIIGASYFNDPSRVVATPDCRRELCTGNRAFADYPHPDHLAVSSALAQNDFGALEGNLVATWPRPMAITYRHALDEDTYCSLMCESPDDTGVPVGLMQSWYGWLAFPGDHWPQTEVPVQAGNGRALIMSRQQAFLSYYGAWNRVAP